jgi:hypothetical protein
MEVRMGRKKDKKHRKVQDDFDQDRAHDDGMPPAPESPAPVEAEDDPAPVEDDEGDMEGDTPFST